MDMDRILLLLTVEEKLAGNSSLNRIRAAVVTELAEINAVPEDKPEPKAIKNDEGVKNEAVRRA